MTTGSKACHWEFLLPWFMQLKDLLEPFVDDVRVHSDTVRVGTDVEDWWIQVYLHDELTNTARLRTIREALLLVGAFGQTSHDVCWQYLQSFSLFARAPFMDLDDPKFVPRFLINLEGFSTFLNENKDQEETADKIPFDMKNALGALFTMDNLSDDFKRDWARLREFRQEVARVHTAVRPVELQLVVQFDDDTVIARDLPSIIESIQAVQDRQRKRSSTPLADRLLQEPVFVVKEIDLFVFDTPLTIQTLGLIRQLIELGVSMKSVRVEPKQDEERSQEETEAWRWVWRDLMCSITGQTHRKVPNFYVRQLSVPRTALQEPMLSSLFSALVSAGGVRELDISQEAYPLDQSVAEREQAERRRPETEAERKASDAFWYWMGCVLFQESASSPSLASVSLLGDCIEARVLGILKPFKTGKIHPLAALTKKIVPGLTVDRVPDGKSITIPRGVEVTFHSTIGGETETLTTPEPIPTIVVYHDKETSSVLLLVPGLGICSVDASVLPLKRRRVELTAREPLVLTSRLRNFVIFRKRGRAQDSVVLEQFIDLIGDSLQGLGLRIPTLTVADLRAILAKCPSLEGLSVGWASLPSLDFVFEAYNNGSKISSLEFMGGELDDQDQNIRKLFDELRDRNSAITKTLRRLHITWPIERWELIDAPDKMLNENKDLTHFSFSPSRAGRTQWTVERHHGELLRDAPLILDDDTRLSLSRVMRHVARTYPTVQLNDNVQDLIRHFASTTQRRTAICDANA